MTHPTNKAERRDHYWRVVRRRAQGSYSGGFRWSWGGRWRLFTPAVFAIRLIAYMGDRRRHFAWLESEHCCSCAGCNEHKRRHQGNGEKGKTIQERRMA